MAHFYNLDGPMANFYNLDGPMAHLANILDWTLLTTQI